LRSWAYTVRLPRAQGPPRFAGDVFLDWARAIGVVDAAWEPVPVPRDQAVDRAVRASVQPLTVTGGPRVVLNASASWPAKGWPLEHFAELARLLRARLDASVWLAWGPGEESARDAMVARAEGALTALPPTDLVQLAACLAQADLLITTDSGPKHIAVAEGTPTLTLFGSTDPRGWQPPGGRHVWITHDVACRPCDLTRCPVPGHPCLDLLTPGEVAHAAAAHLALLGKTPARPAGDGRSSHEVVT
jgi:ADP-heptose:LPS heptosyltransferase